ncbi:MULTISPECIES: peptidoglycan DD-metalloendopeptidase family protein [Vibrio]|uniref:peptidoglycan DD-metalloendopeptidase family protein n=1 Tax=Vibrio TaxID=662 RepID=UPI0002DC3EF7|nr:MULTISPECIES: peptidoglycan DD-metalloendopeptidase family protein [Vibrio]KAA8599097.1 Cell wall endopeptidase family M23/M37 [Vibrio cyclitrophicus]OED71952.1 peptidase M23 [Vibrio cyclitrophicus ZF99]OEE11174.1 peptidase M23 [Vibrio cyclitrophicus ZF264]OEE85467.1 peptidase M23 [Vibrio cyclitrophicus FF160]OEF27960.1 peptidase M23 [Vibrio cyclitrophicus 1F97]|tara:strand:+ start:2430 stop:3686 length:1257 start_codon:yes stop_codon:yes gene_type:complete
MKFLRSGLIIIAISAFSLATLLSFHSEPVQEVSIKITPYQDSQSSDVAKVHSQSGSNSLVKVHYFVKVGDTLSNIFSSWKLPYGTVQKVMEADLESLKLDTIKPGDHLELLLDGDSKQLVELIFHESLVEQAVFTKNNDGSFDYQFHEVPGEWKEKLYAGTVHGSFSTSAYKAGLTTAQIANITRTLRDKINFARELRAGDSFNVLVKEQYTDNHLTGKTEVQGISINLRNREVAAFLAPDGRFYDRAGNSLEQAFDRYPVARQFRRITSSFNPYRKHPVTGRISPHNGTDFATPVGAPVYSTGDGRVVAIRNHPYAGKYLVIEHNSVYKTRYLHLSRFLVKKGQQVKRGQKIALSGATGRITGPHLHFEVLVRGRAVNAMKANLPMASSILPQNKKEFLARIASFDGLITDQKSSAS